MQYSNFKLNGQKRTNDRVTGYLLTERCTFFDFFFPNIQYHLRHIEFLLKENYILIM